MNRDARFWDETARQWDVNADQLLWRRHSDAVNSRMLERWLPRPAAGARAGAMLKTDLFDEAFGEGGLIDLLGERAAVVVGMDVSPEVAGAARARCPAATHVIADVRRLPFRDAGFDCIVSLSTLDHFESHEQIEASVRELARTLRPGGQLLLTMDNAANPVVWLRNVLLYPWLHRVGIVPYFVGKTCGPRRLRRIVERAGLNVREMGAVLHCPRVAAVAIAKRLNRATARAQRRFLDAMMKFERLERWPARYFSGYFVAVRATKS